MSDFQEQLAFLRRRIAKIDKKFAAPKRAIPIPKPQPQIPAPEEWQHGEEVVVGHTPSLPRTQVEL